MRSSEENQVLEMLAKEWEFKGPPGIMDINDIVAVLPIAPSETLAALKSLYTCGLIDMNTLKTSAFLTPEGYVAADRSGNRQHEES